MIIKGQFIDIINQQIFPASVEIKEGKIHAVKKIEAAPAHMILPGFIDAHIHIESSMLAPSEFAVTAVGHGTVGTISDPHEIANVLGVEGVEYMIDNGNTVPLKFHFGAPSCVPATSFETAGAEIGPDDIDKLLQRPDIVYLAEMMNWPGVLFNDDVVMQKLALAKKYGKVIDGHAPGLKGEDAKKYIDHGISTDHECFTIEEAQDKLKYGMKVIIREGSAAKNFEALIPLAEEHWENMMFCSDDKHPDELIEGHIDQLVKRAINKGVDPFKVLQMACINPVRHYGMRVGILNEGDPADFIIIDDLKNINVLQTFIDGIEVSSNKKAKFSTETPEIKNNFNCTVKSKSAFQLPLEAGKYRVIEAEDGQLITKTHIFCLEESTPNFESDTDQDILKMTVVNRYTDSAPALALIKNFGIKEGAIASSVGHDSHNIIAVGSSDAYLKQAVNLLIQEKGGIAAVSKNSSKVLPLPIAGIMSPLSCTEVGHAYEEIDAMAKEMGSLLKAPFMSLSFMALLVIPQLKLSDKGLFDGSSFQFVDLKM